MTPPANGTSFGKAGPKLAKPQRGNITAKALGPSRDPLAFRPVSFLAILVWLFVSAGAAGWQGLLADADVGWHIRTGEYILDHPRPCLVTTCTRFQKPGAPWYAWEWGVDLMDGALQPDFSGSKAWCSSQAGSLRSTRPL